LQRLPGEAEIHDDRANTPAHHHVGRFQVPVIDWDSASRGDPLGDVACTSRLLRTASLPLWSPGSAQLLLRCLRTFMHRSYLKRYFRLHEGMREQIEAWQVPLAVPARTSSARSTCTSNASLSQGQPRPDVEQAWKLVQRTSTET
jgi:hypothetical protein